MKRAQSFEPPDLHLISDLAAAGLSSLDLDRQAVADLNDLFSGRAFQRAKDDAAYEELYQTTLRDLYITQFLAKALAVKTLPKALSTFLLALSDLSKPTPEGILDWLERSRGPVPFRRLGVRPGGVKPIVPKPPAKPKAAKPKAAKPKAAKPKAAKPKAAKPKAAVPAKGTAGVRRASHEARVTRETKSDKPAAPLTANQRAIAIKLRKEHPNLHRKVAEDAARGAWRKPRVGADLELANGRVREVKVIDKTPLEPAKIAGNLEEKAAQRASGVRVSEIYAQLDGKTAAGASPEKVAGVMREIRGKWIGLRGVFVKIFGPDGRVLWKGTL